MPPNHPINQSMAGGCTERAGEPRRARQQGLVADLAANGHDSGGMGGVSRPAGEDGTEGGNERG